MSWLEMYSSELGHLLSRAFAIFKYAQKIIADNDHVVIDDNNDCKHKSKNMVSKAIRE